VSAEGQVPFQLKRGEGNTSRHKTHRSSAYTLESAALCTSSMTNGKLQVDEDGWLYLGRNTETLNDSKVNSQTDLELQNEMMKNINP
jgi:hypothetical protein